MEMEDLVNHIEILQAYKNGYVIEVLNDDGSWSENDGTFHIDNIYRVASVSSDKIFQKLKEGITLRSKKLGITLRPNIMSVNDWRIDDVPF